ncbi:acidic phospholipase A2 2-like [Diadema antillarum]|uniref:acidic phospholipase A2 2-like n=1 Tax=Diadema antillarum TaxID=105358 RepID=UPI003A8B715A
MNTKETPSNGGGSKDLVALRDMGKRKRRALGQFGSMITCATGRSPWDFYGYGCWCGFGGQGQPVDPLDECCFHHDRCYDRLVSDNVCSRAGLYWWSYVYSEQNCQESTPPVITCYKSRNACAEGLCQCDRQAALCFAGQSYNDEHKANSNC